MYKIILSLALSFVFYSFAALAQPKLEIIGGDTYDWGKVSPKDNPLKSKIILKNNGNEKLIITNIRPGCGCTTAPLTKTELVPGDTSTIDVTLTISSMPGPIHKSITITSNDKDFPTKFLNLKATISVPIELSPTQYFTFNEMKVGVETSATLSIKNASDKEITFSDISLYPQTINCNLSGKFVIKAGEKKDITIKVTPNKTGYFNCSVKFKTSHPDYSEFAIQGFGQVGESAIFNNK